MQTLRKLFLFIFISGLVLFLIIGTIASQTNAISGDELIYLPLLIGEDDPLIPSPTPTATNIPPDFDYIVGDGSPESCTSAALADLLALGGSIGFDCGPDVVTIYTGEPFYLTEHTVLNGQNMVVIDGQGQVNLFEAADDLYISFVDMALINGFSAESGAAFHTGLNNDIVIHNVQFDNHISTNQAYCGGGGAIYANEGTTLRIENSTFSNNRAQNGGALATDHTELIVLQSNFDNNQAIKDDLTITSEDEAYGRSLTGVCAGGGAIHVSGTLENQLDEVLLWKNSFSNNTTNQHGGAVFFGLHTSDQVLIDATTFAANSAEADASGGWVGQGGALWVGPANAGDTNFVFNIENSTFNENQAGSRGGAIWSRIDMELINVTLTANQAVNPFISDPSDWQAGSGGALAIEQVPQVLLNNVTIAENHAGYTGGGIFGDGVAAQNTIVADNSADIPQQTQQNCSHPLLDWGNNLQYLAGDFTNDQSNCGTVITLADPQLGELSDNGGTTATMALLPSSAAIDAGNNATCADTDQRGIARPQGVTCDIGAFELDGDFPTPTATNTPPPTDTPVPTDTPGPTNTPSPTPTTDPNVTPTVTATPTATSTPGAGGDTVVGDGTPGSCTEAAFAAALALGGLITFDCGPSPVTIPMTMQHTIALDTTLDGGNLITLDGQDITGILRSEDHLTVALHNITLNNGHTEGQGGAFEVGYFNDLTVLNSSFDNNYALADHLICDGGGAFFIGGGGVAHFEGVTFTNNYANNGGAINNLRTKLTIIDTVFENNHAIHTDFINQFGDCGGGGGLYFDGTRKPEDGGPDPIVIDNVIFRGNTTNNHGGAIFFGIRSGEHAIISNTTFEENIVTISPTMNWTGTGGAVWVGQGVGGQVGYTFTIEDSIFKDNHAEFQGGGFWTRSPSTLQNVTFVGNTAINPNVSDLGNWQRGNGGAITAADQAQVKLINVTVTDNTAGFNGGGLNGENIIAQNTIVANNIGEWDLGLQQNCTHYVLDWGNNLQYLESNPSVHHSNCGPTLMFDDPLLGTLGNYGGATETVPLLAGSPAIDAGNNATCTETDQRGVSRPQGAACDLGAYEVETNQILDGWQRWVWLPTLALPIVWRIRPDRRS